MAQNPQGYQLEHEDVVKQVWDAAYVALSIRELRDFTSADLTAHLDAKGLAVPPDVLEARLSHLVATGWIRYDEGRYRT